jgi:4-hydroxybenzoate polyprenyltransferase
MKLLDYLFLHRPMLIIPVWTIALLGNRAALWRSRSSNPFHLDGYPFSEWLPGDSHLLLMMLCGALVAGGAFVLNQIYDIETDRKNKKLFLLPEGHVSLAEAWFLYFFSTVIGIAAGFLLNWQLGILLACGALLGLQYSHPRFKVRQDPWRSLRNNMLAHGMLAFLFGWVLAKNFDIESVLKSVPYMLGVAALYLNTTLPDIKGDESAGKKTYGVELGVKRTESTALFLVVLALIASVLTADYAFTIAAAVALPFFVMARVNKSIDLSVLATKAAVLALSIMAALYFPPYLLLLILTILLSRLYHARRFSISYPSLGSESK